MAVGWSGGAVPTWECLFSQQHLLQQCSFLWRLHPTWSEGVAFGGYLAQHCLFFLKNLFLFTFLFGNQTGGSRQAECTVEGTPLLGSLGPSSLAEMLQAETCLSLPRLSFFFVGGTGDDNTEVPDAGVDFVQWECGRAPDPQTERWGR